MRQRELFWGVSGVVNMTDELPRHPVTPRLCYSELSTRFPKAGSAYVYVYATAGELLAFLVGWALVLEYALAACLSAKALSRHLAALSFSAIRAYRNGSNPLESSDSPPGWSQRLLFEHSLANYHVPGFDPCPDIVAAAVPVLLTAALVAKPKVFIVFLNTATIANMFVLVALMLTGFFKMNADNWTAGAGFFSNGIVGVSFLFVENTGPSGLLLMLALVVHSPHHVLIGGQESDIKERLANLVYDGIIEDLTHFAPIDVLYVYYKKGVNVAMGNTLTVSNTSRQPEDVSFNALPDNYYTVLLVDLDAPSRSEPSLRSYRHWLVVNGMRRLNAHDLVDSARSQFDVRTFATANDLGDPVGINYFLVEARSARPRAGLSAAARSITVDKMRVLALISLGQLVARFACDVMISGIRLESS
ncbi:hypothetical protein HPB50_012488 [Hyalomma asiaticum]|uniref:Uncharacterized protein n=1 Tax=Hyalomma asiaticum TaxID=266040 RepID=A0ACB7SD88_HYAAI|nr:hypothetical protein HPB50_012488 [Hyalomma asiaticum]